VDERHWRMLVRLFSGEATPAEREELRLWMEADPARGEEVVSLRALWDASGALPERGDQAAAWTRVAERTGVGAPAKVRAISSARRAAAPAPRRMSPWARPALRAAAVLVLALGAALLWKPVAGAVRENVLERTATTAVGERREVTLPDGTRVLLGVNSRLRYPRWFLGHRRDVHLEGAAYFEVAHDASRPFSVITADAVTRVLGTKFTVRDYPGAEPARVAVTEGRVAVRARRAGPDGQTPVAILGRGEAAEVPPGGVAAVIQRPAERPDLAWTRGTIAFNNAPVRQVVAEIGRWYDVELQVADPALAERHLTITFENEPLDTLLKEIAAALNARIERRGRVLVLTALPGAASYSPIHAAGDGSL
jgi:transmembrane sensor